MAALALALSPTQTQLDAQLQAGNAALNATSTDQGATQSDPETAPDPHATADTNEGADQGEGGEDDQGADATDHNNGSATDGENTTTDADGNSSTSNTTGEEGGTDTGDGKASTIDDTETAQENSPAPSQSAARAASDGKNVTVIGDSVSLASAPALRKALPGAVIDAAEGRQFKHLPEVAAKLSKKGKMRDTVVIALATNSTVNTKALRKMIEDIPAEHIILVTGYGDRPWIPRTNSSIAAVAKESARVTVAQWEETATASESLIGSDGIHPTKRGMDTYAQVIATAIGAVE